MNYYNELPNDFMSDEVALTILGVFLAIFAVILLVCLVCWIIRSVALHKLAKRRGIRHAWMAWIPIGGDWVLGSVSDQYQHLVKGKITSRRKVLLVLTVAAEVVAVSTGAMSWIPMLTGASEEVSAIITLLGMFPALISWGCGIAVMVFRHICSFDLYRSSNPNNAVVFLVLGIILPITEPFFYFNCRFKDFGMVRPEPAPAPAPVELPEETPDF